MTNEFEGQTAVVTGGTRGIGRAIALDLLARGARVHATYVANASAAEELREAAGEHAERLFLSSFDVGDYAACQSFWETLDEEAEDGVAILVHNAGIRRDKVIAMLPPDDWSKVIETNLSGSYNMVKFAVQNMMRQRYGRIVLVTSPSGQLGFAGQANYAASKAGQVGLARSVAREVAKRGITVNCVSPGFIETELIADLPEEVRRAHQSSVPMRRFGRPDEVAYAVRSLLSPEATYITGSTLEITGGL